MVGTAFNGSVINSYESGKVLASGVPGVGGLIGTSQLSPFNEVNSFYNSDLNSAGSCGSGSIGLTTAQMQNFNTYANTYTGWDFTNVWAPPSQSGQAGQTSGYYPQLYATSPVVFTAAAATTKTYGANNPALGTVSGGPGSYAFGPSGDSLPLTSLFGTTATAASGVGQYAITPVAANSVNSALGVAYRVIDAGTSGSLTTDPAPLTVTYTANAATGTYGAAIPALSGSETAAGLVNGDTLTSVTAGTASFGTTATSASNVGSYAVIGSGLSANSANYNFTFQQAAGNATALTINPAPLLVTYTANSATGTYGSAIPALSGSETAAGLVNGDTLTSITAGTASFGTAATSASNVGSYAIIGSGLSANSSNYNFTFQQAAGNASALTINARLVTVTANDLEKAFAAPNPALTYVIAPAGTNTGLINGATLSGILATAASQSSPSGNYAITEGTLTAPGNYSIVYIAGTLKVDLPPLQSLNAFLEINSPVSSGQGTSSNAGNGTGCSPNPSSAGTRKGDVVITNSLPGGTCSN